MSPDWSQTYQPMMLPQIISGRSSAKTASKSKSASKSCPTLATSVAERSMTPCHAAGLMATQPAAQPGENEQVLCKLLKNIAQGDQTALAELYDLTISRVYGVALRVARQPEMAEEVVSDVYMQVWHQAARYDESRGRILGWLVVIARSRALDSLRRQDEAFSHPEPHQLIDEPEDSGHNPQHALLASESHATLHHALLVLTPLQRQLLSLAFFKGLSHSEIVEHSGVPLGSVKTHIRRALTQLRDTLGNDQLLSA